MPKGVWERKESDLAHLRSIAANGKSKGVSRGGLAPRGTSAYKQKIREGRNRYSRTAKGRHEHLRSAAKAAGRVMEITLEQLEAIREDNSCFYCTGTLPMCGHGLDRFDNTKGYTLQNVVACCSACNRRKGRLEGIGFKFPRTVQLMLELMRKPQC
jgi:hypothetical protein